MCFTTLSEPRPFTRDSEFTDKRSRRRGFIHNPMWKIFLIARTKAFLIHFLRVRFYPLRHNCASTHSLGWALRSLIIKWSIPYHTTTQSIRQKKEKTQKIFGYSDTYTQDTSQPTNSFTQKEVHKHYTQST